MTQEQITADEYRTAAKVLRTKQVSDALGVYAAESKWCDSQAARLDAQAAAEAYEWNLALAYTAGYSTQADRPYSGGDDCRRAGIRIVLAKLEEGGRLVPEGGRALTAEQHEDIRSLVGLNGEIHATVRKETSRRLRASLDPWSLPPQPAERCRCGVLEDEPSDGCEWHAARAERAPESWATWQDVPEGVAFMLLGNAFDSIWERQGDQVFSCLSGSGPVPTDKLNHLAPFVRAEAGEKA